MKNILPELRAERGWTQADLAARLKVSRQTFLTNARSCMFYRVSA